MNLFKMALEVLNGKKMTTGTIIIIAVFVLQQVGIEKSEATNIATNVMLATGSVLTAWGYIHRWIKAKKAVKK